mmetsp:Transcript_1954/g.4541  ORF Transcript_1954/g.4541 Transcript_1954/m.4541 type:complete len:272 (-) Transcript_1954:988-1803(-)
MPIPCSARSSLHRESTPWIFWDTAFSTPATAAAISFAVSSEAWSRRSRTSTTLWSTSATSDPMRSTAVFSMPSSMAPVRPSPSSPGSAAAGTAAIRSAQASMICPISLWITCSMRSSLAADLIRPVRYSSRAVILVSRLLILRCSSWTRCSKSSWARRMLLSNSVCLLVISSAFASTISCTMAASMTPCDSARDPPASPWMIASKTESAAFAIARTAGSILSKAIRCSSFLSSRLHRVLAVPITSPKARLPFPALLSSSVISVDRSLASAI